MGGSLVILACFCLGAACGWLVWAPQYLLEHDVTLYVLYLLMLLVGFSIGYDRRLGEILRTLRPRVLLLPLATTLGTFAGAALISLFLVYSASECLAVSAGFAYYSLSSVIISMYKGPELATVGLMANIMRELLTLLAAPLLVRRISPLAPISCGGASTMDTTLPVIARCAGQQWVFVSIVHAIILDVSVSFWVSLFCTW